MIRFLIKLHTEKIFIFLSSHKFFKFLFLKNLPEILNENN